jgi:hypothetical protein
MFLLQVVDNMVFRFSKYIGSFLYYKYFTFTVTGALKVTGGVGIGGDLFVGGNINSF